MNGFARTGAALLFALLLAGCGGGGGSKTTSTASSTAAASPAAEQAQIRQVWQAFFSSKTPPSRKASLVQNGSRFSSVIAQMAKSPLASHTSATVKKVTLRGPGRATVRYTIDVAGKPALANQTGAAVRENGSWKVGDASFCKLIALEGQAPSACKGG
jgi:hypothetical protein